MNVETTTEQAIPEFLRKQAEAQKAVQAEANEPIKQTDEEIGGTLIAD